MGTVLSCASAPSSPSNGNNFETERYRIRQLDARYRKKAVMTLRISDTELIIEAKGKRRQPELVASLIPDPNRYSLQRYGVPDQAHIGCPSILIDLKGYDHNADVKYVFFCRENTRLFDRLQQKVNQQKNSLHRPSSIRSTPIPTPVAPITPTPFFPNVTPDNQFNPPPNRLSSTSTEPNQYYNDSARDEHAKQLSHKGSTQSFKNSGVLNPTPLSPVPETDHAVKMGGLINLARAPKNRDEMLSRRNEGHFKHHQPRYEFPKPPPRPGLNSNLYQNPSTANDYSRTSLSTSSGQNINQLSARSDCEPLLLSNLSTPNNQNLRYNKPNSAEHIYVNQTNPSDVPRTPSFNPSGPFTAPAGPGHRRFFFPPMDPPHRDDRGGSMNYVTVEHNSISSSNSTPRTPKTPGVTVQYTPVDFQKTDELHRSCTGQKPVVRSDSRRK